MVLAARDQPVKHLGGRCTLVRLERRPVAHVEQRIGLLGTRCHHTAGTVILERASDKHLVVGQ